MNVRLTDAAKRELERIEEDGRYLRIALSRSGCCSYTFEFYPDCRKKDDLILETDGHKILFTEREKLLLESVKEIDYGRKGIFRSFKAVMM